MKIVYTIINNNKLFQIFLKMGIGKSQFSEDELQDYQVLLFNN